LKVSNLVLFFSSKNEKDIRSTERIVETLEQEELECEPFDLSQKYFLYGHSFTYENSFMQDYCENGHRDHLSTPVLRAGRHLFTGEEEITSNIPYLKAKYGR